MFSNNRDMSISSNKKWINLVNTPRAYQLVTSADKTQEEKVDPNLTFYVLGCAGDLNSAQNQVAELMDRVARAQKKPLAIFLLGDNFYQGKLENLNDAAFQKNFYDVYHRVEMTGIHGVPFFVILGNHDHELHFLWRKGGEIDYDAVGMQVMHSYIDHHGEIDAKKWQLYSEPTLALDVLPKWNMPSRYYALRYQNIEFFLIDSSTYVKDYLRSLREPDDTTNQANWLKKEFFMHSDRIKLLFSHHPLTTVGKRYFYDMSSSDTHIYLTPAEIEALKNLGFNGNYNALLKQIMHGQKMQFDSVFVAHDHAMYYYHSISQDENFCQVVAGGGGGSLQSRESFQDWEKVPAFINDYGFVGVSIDTSASEKKMEFDFYGTQGLHLRFCNNHLRPIQEGRMMESGVAILHDIVLTAYQKYFTHLSQQQNNKSTQAIVVSFYQTFRHGQTGVNRADNLRNFFNDFDKPTLQKTIDYLTQLFASAGFGSANSLMKIIYNEILAKFGLPWEAFIKSPELALKLPIGMKAVNVEEKSVSSVSVTAHSVEVAPVISASQISIGATISRTSYLFSLLDGLKPIIPALSGHSEKQPVELNSFVVKQPLSPRRTI